MGAKGLNSFVPFSALHSDHIDRSPRNPFNNFLPSSSFSSAKTKPLHVPSGKTEWELGASALENSIFRAGRPWTADKVRKWKNMKIRVAYTDGRVPGADSQKEKWTDIKLRKGNFAGSFAEADLNGFFGREMHGWSGGEYRMILDSRDPLGRGVPAGTRIGSIGEKYWKFDWNASRIDFLTILLDSNGRLNNVIEDAYIDDVIILSEKISPRSGNYGSGWLKNNGNSVFASMPLKLYWMPYTLPDQVPY